MTKQERINFAVDTEMAKLARVTENISAACSDGRITPDAAAVKIERAEQWCEKRVAWITKEQS